MNLQRVAVWAIAAWASVPAIGQSIHAVSPHAGGTFSSVLDISSDGSAAAGWADNASSTDLALRWTVANGTFNMGLLPGGAFNSYAEAISPNGMALAGYGGTPSGSRAFRWNAGTASYTVLPPLPGHTFATGADISGDGNRVVGVSGLGNAARAFLWNNLAPGSSADLGVVAGQPWSNAMAISGDGSTVTGSSGTVAFRWTSGGGMQSLGSLAGQSSAEGVAASTNGSTIAGIWRPGGSDRGFRWTAASGMVDLGLLAGGSVFRVRDMSEDGVVVVGQANGPSGLGAAVWTPRNGLQTLAQHLQARGVILTGWQLTDCNAVNANGTAFGGSGLFNGTPRGWVVRGLSIATIQGVPGTWTSCVNATLTITFSGNGSGSTGGSGHQWRWFKAGVPVTEGLQPSGATITGTLSQALTFSSLTASEAGVYALEVTVQGAAPVMGPAQTVVVNTASPTITTQPVPTNACAGGTTVLTVAATPGIGTTLYQWQRRVNPFPNVYEDIIDGPTGFGSTFSGTTTNTLNINNSQAGDTNRYRCIVMNSVCGAANYTASDRVMVTIVGTAPTINSQPVPTAACIGSAASLTVAATPGAGSLMYQWQRLVPPFPNVYQDIVDGPTGFGSTFSGTSSSTLTIINAQAADSNRYRCLVMDSVCGMASYQSTDRVLVSIVGTTSIVATPVSTVACGDCNGTAQFSVGASPTAGATYRWQKRNDLNGVYFDLYDGPSPNWISSFSGTNTPTLTITRPCGDDFTAYRCVVFGLCNTVVSRAARLSPADPFHVASESFASTVCPGGTVVLPITLGGGNIGTPSFSWRSWNRGVISDGLQPTGSIVTGAQSDTLQISGFTPGDGDWYYCVISGPCNSVMTGLFPVLHCPADFNCDGGIDGDDIIAFFAAWENGDMMADTNGDGGVDGDDISTFFTAWENGGC
jgi:hypothetical protein